MKIGSLQINNVGLEFKRNAFSINPLRIVYHDTSKGEEGSNNNNKMQSLNDDECNKIADATMSMHDIIHQCKPTYETRVYVQRIANTNFSKAFRPGSYGSVETIKMGSWVCDVTCETCVKMQDV